MRKEQSQTRNNFFKESKKRKIDTAKRGALDHPPSSGKHLFSRDNLFKNNHAHQTNSNKTPLKSCLLTAGKKLKNPTKSKVHWVNDIKTSQADFFDEIADKILQLFSPLEDALPSFSGNVVAFLNELGLKEEATVSQFYDSNAGSGILDQALTDANSYLLEFINSCTYAYPSIKDTIRKKLSDDKLLLGLLYVEEEENKNPYGDLEAKRKFRLIKIKLLFEIDPEGTKAFFQENKENMFEQLKNEFEQVCPQNKFSMRL